jgi:hypothetical protein
VAHYISAAGELAAKHPALSAITTGFERIAKSLFAGGETIVHGDFHLANILVRDESIFPIDWEMTGTSAGEIDLAALVDGWPEVAEACEKAYADVRWPEGKSGDLDLRLGAAQVCLYVEKLSCSVEPAQGDLEGLGGGGTSQPVMSRSLFERIGTYFRWDIYRKLLPYVKPYKWPMLFVLGLQLVYVAFGLLEPWPDEAAG